MGMHHKGFKEHNGYGAHRERNIKGANHEGYAYAPSRVRTTKVGSTKGRYHKGYVQQMVRSTNTKGVHHKG